MSVLEVMLVLIYGVACTGFGIFLGSAVIPWLVDRGYWSSATRAFARIASRGR